MPWLESETFLWVPDPSAGRRLRRLFAESDSYIGLRVGTYPELIELLAGRFLLPSATDWSGHLHEILAGADDAFWSASYQRDPSGVASAVESAWREVRVATRPGQTWPTNPDPRIAARLADLARLNAIPEKDWPHDLMVMAAALDPDQAPIRPVSIVKAGISGELNVWEQQLLHRFRTGPSARFVGVQNFRFRKHLRVSGDAQSNRLAQVRRGLGRVGRSWPDDESVELVNVRDSLEAIEVAIGAIRKQLDDDASLAPADFGLLIPHDYAHGDRLAHLAAQSGIPLANLPRRLVERDLGTELIRFALIVFSGAPPSMAMRALLAHPLMPWTPSQGRDMAQRLLDYGFRIRPPKDLETAHRDLIELLSTTPSPDEIPNALATLVRSLRADADLEFHRRRAEAQAQLVTAEIRAGQRDITKLLKRLDTTPVEMERDREVSLEGVCVVREGELPLRTVKRLFVLDFLEGHFPSVPGMSPVFSPSEWRDLAAAGTRVRLPVERAATERRLFRKQIDNVEEQLIVLIPRMGLSGEALHPSTSLMDFALTAGSADAPESVVLDLDRAEHRRRLSWLPTVEAYRPSQPRALQVSDLALGRNLVNRFEVTDEAGKTLSPSKLESLLVSPLAWLLGQLDALPRTWEPDGFDPLTAGSVAHKVFELLFPAGSRGLDRDTIQARVPALFDAALHEYAPFLLAPEWRVERDNLHGVIERAANGWSDMLGHLDAELLVSEVGLRGEFERIALYGKADAVLRLPEGALAVVDYKNASGSRFEKRMSGGWDLQTALYNRMLATGGPTDEAVRAQLGAGDAHSTLYYAMTSRTACANFDRAGVPAWRFAGDDTSSLALSLLKERLTALRAGRVALPRSEQIKTMEKAGVGTYALNESPLTAIQIDDSGGEP